MNQKKIAVLFGGCSPEYEVSLTSAQSVLEHLDREKFCPVLVGITRQGQWLYYPGQPGKIGKDQWWKEPCCVPAVLSPDRKRSGLLLLRKEGIEEITLDAVFPVLHGRNGEDGSIQGLCQLAGLPVVGCGVLSSALCMDKDRAHRLVKANGIPVPRSVRLQGMEALGAAEEFAGAVGYPLFVKPVRAGSSYGITRVKSREELKGALERALKYDDAALLEENIPGFEVGCAIMGSGHLTVGAVDEIELQGGFFDFEEKYTLKTSRIYVPARISSEKAREVQETAKKIFRVLGCDIFARVDMFLTPEGKLVFNEVNTIPGFTPHSRFPGMMAAAGISFPEVLVRLVETAVLEGDRA